MSTFLLRRPVDWSLLTNGFHIPTEFHPLLYAMPGGELHHGDKRGVKIMIDGEMFDAPTILHEILTNGTLLSKKHEYICFTDAPITCYLSNLEYFDSWKERGFKAMFSQYGIGIARDWLIENLGARPVIYGQPDEINLLNESIRWRFQELDIHKGDYSWLREWRIPMKELNLYEIPREHIIFIAPKEEELKGYAVDWDFDVDFDYDHGESHPYLFNRNYQRNSILEGIFN